MKSVSLVGSFTDWEKRPVPLIEGEPDIWYAEVELSPGRYEYLFLTDGGEWLPDPEAEESVGNPWGGVNSVVEVEV